jgi:hypothetical protein
MIPPQAGVPISIDVTPVYFGGICRDLPVESWPGKCAGTIAEIRPPSTSKLQRSFNLNVSGYRDVLQVHWPGQLEVMPVITGSHLVLGHPC